MCRRARAILFGTDGVYHNILTYAPNARYWLDVVYEGSVKPPSIQALYSYSFHKDPKQHEAALAVNANACRITGMHPERVTQATVTWTHAKRDKTGRLSRETHAKRDDTRD